MAGTDGRYAFTPAEALNEGTATITAVAQDVAGNRSPAATLSLTVDTTAPDAPTIAALPVITNDATPTITGTAAAGSTVTVLNGTTIIGTAVADGAETMR